MMNLSDRKVQMWAFAVVLIWTVITLTASMWLFGSNPVPTVAKVTPTPALSSAEESNIKIKLSANNYKTNTPSYNQVIGVLMIACNRTELLRSSLNQLVKIRKETRDRFASRYNSKLNSTLMTLLKLPIVVSLDCNHHQTHQMVKSMVEIDQIMQYPNANVPVPNLTKKERKMEGYFRISRHYHWAINEVFQENPSFEQLIIVEEDLNFSPDFFEYFLSLAPLLHNDHTLMCISAWNDNGKEGLIDTKAKSLLYRTDFFPGLGWMLQRSMWDNELKHHWPLAFWDDWLRHWERMRNRTCIRPEVSRTSTSGKKGVSKGQFFDQHLKFIHHSEGYVPFYDQQNQMLSELNNEEYQHSFHDKVYQDSEEIHPIKLKYIKAATEIKNVAYRLTYHTRTEFEVTANMFGLMSDFKNGVPRTAYLGVVSFTYRGYRVFLAPPITRKIYIKEWT